MFAPSSKLGWILKDDGTEIRRIKCNVFVRVNSIKDTRILTGWNACVWSIINRELKQSKYISCKHLQDYRHIFEMNFPKAQPKNINNYIGAAIEQLSRRGYLKLVCTYLDIPYVKRIIKQKNKLN